MMNPFSLALSLLAAFAIAGCVNIGGGASGDDSVTSTASLSDGGRNVPQVSDSEIASTIQEAFRQDDLLSKSSITVNSSQGTVSLSGRLSARAANRAMSVARSAPGVRRVIWASIDYIPE